MQNFLEILKASLKSNYSKSEIGFIGYLLLEKITGLSRTQLLAQKDLCLDENQRQEATSFVERLKNNEPIQYILGETEFYGLRFKVNPSVLIPRPETEELVEWVVLPPNPLKGETRILDIGTGSGCIAISLKKSLPNAEVYAMDVSADALKVAKENAELNNVEVNFILDDILQPRFSYPKFDIIISNPPYIPISEKVKMDKNVTDFEPSTALFTPDNDPLLFYRTIAKFAQKQLNSSGALYFESHRDYAEACKELLVEHSFMNVEIRKDISGNDRMVRGILGNKCIK